MVEIGSVGGKRFDMKEKAKAVAAALVLVYMSWVSWTGFSVEFDAHTHSIAFSTGGISQLFN